MYWVLSTLLFLLSADAVYSQLETYRAAVLEFSPLTGKPTVQEDLQSNIQELVRHIQNAASEKAEIVILPEYGLTGIKSVDSNLDILSTEVPDGKQHSLPCTSNNVNYSLSLKEFSCAAQINKIYVVVNLIEKEIKSEKTKPIYYNTNVVFNKNGEIIVRYRKINLYEEPYVESGNEIVTFTTDFGVTFGMFICFDILFKKPSVDILSNPNVTDVITSQAWISMLPSGHSLTIQHGYAKTHGINLLVAGLDIPSEGTGGSGIYLADGRVAGSFLSGKPKSKLIVQDVPKLSARTPNSSCNFQKPSVLNESVSENVNDFYTVNPQLPYSTKALTVQEKSLIIETVCSDESNFCCTFNISTGATRNIGPTYFYRVAAFQGAWLASSTGTVGIRSCILVACLNDSVESCASREGASLNESPFEKVSVKATVYHKDTVYMPVTLKSNLMPATDYTFCSVDNGSDKLDISMETSGQNHTFLTFGILGRVYSYDGLSQGLINNASHANKLSSVVLLLTIWFYIFRNI